VLRGTPVSLHDGGSPAFVGRRLSHFLCSMAAKLSFEPTHDGDEAGLTVYMNEKYHYDLAITRIDGHQKMIFRRTVGSLRTENIRDCGAGPAILQIQAQRDMFTFSVQQGSTDAVLGSGETHLLSTEVAGGFTGIIIAMYAHNPSGEGAPSLFDWFVYAPLD
ncbi:TPA: hypothetical protein VJT00_001827, partial [Streptococcus pyogenes]|nr:hypothetical protein [Streptococcus pyogenes]